MNINRDIPVIESYDVVVCGGGPSGIPAALAARRAGLKVLLVEAAGQLGGTGTSSGVSQLLGGRTLDNKHQAVGGIFEEITQELYRRGSAIDPSLHPDDNKISPMSWGRGRNGLASGVSFNPIAMVAVLDEKMLEAGVDVLYFTGFVDVVVEANRITHVILFNKSGLFAVPAQAVVDATGDADVAARSGCLVQKGRESDGLMTPATLMFHVDHVDQEALSHYIDTTNEGRFRKLIMELREKGEWTFPYDIFIGLQLHETGTLMINTTRICDVDGTDGRSISKGMMQGRQEVEKLFGLMRKYFPGFANAKIRFVAPMLGIRETRRIIGPFVYTFEAALHSATFPDTIGFSGYNHWDLPNPKKPSDNPGPANKEQKKTTYFPIPYRCMVPQPIENVICPGRAISVDRDVLGPLREMGPCYAMGHAAGVAAAMAVKGNLPFQDVNTDQLREELRKQGAIVDWHEE